MNLQRRLENIEAHFDVAPIPEEARETYLDCARIIYDFCKTNEEEFSYEALFLAGGMVPRVTDAPALASSCLYYASRFNDNGSLDLLAMKRSLIVMTMVGRYRRVTPLDFFRSLPNRVVAEKANVILAEVYSRRVDYYHLPVSVVAPAYAELARRLLRGLPVEHLPAYSDWRGNGGVGLTQSEAVRAKEPVLPRRRVKYEVISALGEGNYGTVFHARRDGEDLALKQQKDIHSVADELSILSTYLHQNVLKFEGVEANRFAIDIFLELGTPLTELLGESTEEDWIETYLEATPTGRQLPLRERRGYQRDIIAGLQFLHEVGVLHRDLKVDNIIIVQGVAKLADFGLSLQCLLSGRDRRYRSPGMYTVMNRPPEMLWFPKKRDYSFPADVWALGTVLVELETSCSLVVLNDEEQDYSAQTLAGYAAVLGRPPLSLAGRTQTLARVAEVPLAVVSGDALRSLFLVILHYNEHLRPTMAEIMKKFISLLV